MAELDSEFVRHIPCDTCGSSDANSLYSDGHMYCFSCHTYVNGDEPPKMSQSHVLIQGEPQRLRKRKIPEEVCSKYKIYTDNNVLGLTKVPWHLSLSFNFLLFSLFFSGFPCYLGNG